MRVVQTSKAYSPSLGGIETTVTNLSEGLCRKDGVSTQVLVCNHERSFRVTRRQMNGVPVTYAPSWGFISSLPVSPTYGSLLAALKGEILHVHEPFPLADLSVLLSRRITRNFSKIVVSWHSDIVRQKWALGGYRPILHKFLRNVDRILVSTPQLIGSSEYLPLYRDHCEVIPHGVRLEWVGRQKTRRTRVEQIRERFGTPLLLFVGRLVYYKGLKFLVAALSLLPGVRLVMIGSGPLSAELRDQIASLGLEERISIIPPVPEEELHAFYEACDIFVFPSTEKSETYGLVQIEAMACGKPVVSTNLNTGVTYLNQDGITGLIVPPCNSSALADAIQKLVDDKNLRASLGNSARNRALREFSAETMVDRTVELYKRLLA